MGGRNGKLKGSRICEVGADGREADTPSAVRGPVRPVSSVQLFMVVALSVPGIRHERRYVDGHTDDRV